MKIINKLIDIHPRDIFPDYKENHTKDSYGNKIKFNEYGVFITKVKYLYCYDEYMIDIDFVREDTIDENPYLTKDDKKTLENSLKYLFDTFDMDSNMITTFLMHDNTTIVRVLKIKYDKKTVIEIIKFILYLAQTIVNFMIILSPYRYYGFQEEMKYMMTEYEKTTYIKEHNDPYNKFNRLSFTKIIASCFIQSKFKECYYNPKYLFCRNRLKREFENMRFD
jgi:hypothetical protein